MKCILPVGWAFLVLAGSAGAQSPPPVERVGVNGIELAYRVHGAGEPLLLLHFFTGCGQVWDPFVEELALQYRVIVPDLRGHGASAGSGGMFSHRQAAEDIAALLDHLQLPRVRAMGMSSGGMTLLHLATKHPDRVDAMVLIGATSYFPEEARKIMQQVGRDRPAADPAAQRCLTRGEAQFRELQGWFAAFQHSYDDMNFTAPLLSTITARTLIVHGDRDEFFPITIPVEMYRAIPKAELWILPRGGHIPIYGEREQFLRIARRFLAERRP